MKHGMRVALTIYGVLNGVLYASLLPLWEGFDEPFHYAYVQTLSRQRSLPEMNRSTLSEEVWQSLRLAPASQVVKQNLPMVTTYEQYFKLGRAARAELRARLDSLPPATGNTLSPAPSYEAHQPPLSYGVLAVADLLLSHQRLMFRIWCLRLICAVAAVVGSILVGFRLACQLGLPEAFGHAVIFVVLSSQMLYASTAHITNDWLAVPLFTLVVSLAIDLCRAPTSANALRLALGLSAGMLTKAYFLALTPWAFAIILWLTGARRLRPSSALAFFGVALGLGAPWYLRNILFYGNLSGLQETAGGVSLGRLVSEAWSVPWFKTLLMTLRGSLWTGNNSFTAYSLATSIAMLGLIAVGVALYSSRGRTRDWAAEGLTVAACACHVAALGYATVAIHWFTKGEAVAASPWYTQVLLLPGWCLIFLGLSRSGTLGRCAAALVVWLWTYVIGSTYFVKLIPLYAGYPGGWSQLIPLIHWYKESGEVAWGILSQTALLPAGVLLPLALAVVVCGTLMAVLLTRRFPLLGTGYSRRSLQKLR